MKREELIREVNELILEIESPLSQAELANGWTIKSQQATLALLKKIHEALQEKNPTPIYSIGRGLNHWGVVNGPLLEAACTLSNHLCEIES